MSVRFPDSKFISAATVNGRLYDLGAYPGLLLGETDSLVVGEIYEVDDALLQELDEFEASTNYLRRQVEISIGAQPRMCWTYEPDPAFYSLRTLIASGDWLESVRSRADAPE